MSSQETIIKFFSKWLASTTPNEHGEYRMLCPIHDETRPSATINFKKGLFHCNSASCVGGMTIVKLKKMVMEKESSVDKADYDPFGGPSNVVNIAERRKSKSGGGGFEEDPLTEAKVKAYHRLLMDDSMSDQRASFMVRRGLTRATLELYEIGFEMGSGRYLIPIRGIDGDLVNARKYKPDAEASQKMWNWIGMGSPPRLFPVAETQHDEVMIVEGELDALIGIQNGFHCVSGTGGAGRWDKEWNKFFLGKNVIVSYDNDRDGRIGAKKVAKHLLTVAATVKILDPLMDENKSDLTDWFLAGGTHERLRDIIDRTPVYAAKEEATSAEEATAIPIQVIGSMDSSTNGRPLSMTVTVSGRRHPTYSVPKQAMLSCTLDAGNKCKACPMMTEWEGDHTVFVDGKNIEYIARFLDRPEDQRLEVIRRLVGAQKCNRLVMTVEDSHTVEELFVSQSMDSRSEDSADFTQRRLYSIGTHDTETNAVVHVVGTTWPNAKDSRNEFFSWSLKPAVTSVDEFKLSPEIIARLRQFRPSRRQRPIDKAREVAGELQLATGIVGRERLQMAMDLTWHSVLNFKLDGKRLARGWVEFIVVGDTRTGKSETAIRLANYYGLGHIIGCEGASFPGLVGGVKQVGEAWTVTWGEVTLNDRRLVVLDEVSGLSQELISQLSDVRTRGVAQVTKIQSSSTNARCRMIWISNPRQSKFITDSRKDGLTIIKELIGNEEDISRFDLAMSVRGDDVDSSEINKIRGQARDPKYSREDCRNLILWAWSRKTDDVVWSEGAEEKIMAGAEYLGKRFIESPPLIQVQSVREKIARLAVALAARTFSSDETGEKVIVTQTHVADAVNFVNKLYSYDNFGYAIVSQRAFRARAIAESSRREIRKWLKENPALLEFLIERSNQSFRAPDLEEMTFMGRDQVNEVLSRLSEAKMIRKDKSQIVLEPTLQAIVRQLEKESGR